MNLKPRNPEFESAVRGVFARQGLMEAFGVAIEELGPGACALSVGFHGTKAKLQASIQGALLGAMADTAASLAALTLVPKGHGIVTVEYKVSFLEPALGDKVIARARVRRAGRNLTLAEADTLAVEEDGSETLCAVSMHTLMRLDPQGPPRGGAASSAGAGAEAPAPAEEAAGGKKKTKKKLFGRG
ncbi:MAG: PaaI family thioesterase [Marinovum algicola]|uniref:PaaI family thioesterase n=1 Tax=Marinovum algicola TaxID=42444 RepID=UPI0032EC6C1C